ncbi:MAG: MFS transporter [Deltaproteobacteria bacterium]|nr:MFS transporter [Deltaproteobacteria bacterium]
MARSWKLTWLSLLYFVQGLPFGFQATALPILLREQDVSLTGIGLANALALPWMLKLLWAPAVDRFGSKRLGRRRSWIAPMQLALAASAGAAAFVAPDENLGLLLVLVLAMNLFAATMDIAVDGLAVSLLSREELGIGNIAQVVGYKLGMLTGGGLLLWASTTIGYQGVFAVIAGLTVLIFFITLPFREPDTASSAPPTLYLVGRALGAWVGKRGALYTLFFIATYKLGESMADAMFKPFLFDRGFDAGQIGLWVGTWGMVFSVAGSFAGGLLASRGPILRAVAIAAALRAAPVFFEFVLVYLEPTAAQVIAVTAAEHFFGGALTTAMFAFMMSQVDRRIGATHYTALAVVEVIGKSPAAWASGAIADGLGYGGVFALATVLSVAFLGLLVPVSRGISRDSAKAP